MFSVQAGKFVGALVTWLLSLPERFAANMTLRKGAKYKLAGDFPMFDNAGEGSKHIGNFCPKNDAERVVEVLDKKWVEGILYVKLRTADNREGWNGTGVLW